MIHSFAGEMLKQIDGQFWGASEWQLHVTDEQGATVCTLSVKGTTSETQGSVTWFGWRDVRQAPELTQQPT